LRRAGNDKEVMHLSSLLKQDKHKQAICSDKPSDAEK